VHGFGKVEIRRHGFRARQRNYFARNRNTLARKIVQYKIKANL